MTFQNKLVRLSSYVSDSSPDVSRRLAVTLMVNNFLSCIVQVLRNFQLVSHLIDANDIHIQIPISAPSSSTHTQLIPISISATISIYEMFSFRRIIFHVPAALLLLRKLNGKFRHSRAALSDGSRVDALNLLSYYEISLRTDSDGVIKRASEKVGRKTIWLWPQNVKESSGQGWEFLESV